MSVSRMKQKVLDLFEGGVKLSINEVAHGANVSYSTARTYLTWLYERGYLARTKGDGRHYYFAVDEPQQVCEAAIAQCECTKPAGHDDEFHECACGGQWAFGSLEPGDEEHFCMGALPGSRTMLSTPRNRPFDYEVRVLP